MTGLCKNQADTFYPFFFIFRQASHPFLPPAPSPANLSLILLRKTGNWQLATAKGGGWRAGTPAPTAEAQALSCLPSPRPGRDRPGAAQRRLLPHPGRGATASPLRPAASTPGIVFPLFSFSPGSLAWYDYFLDES